MNERSSSFKGQTFWVTWLLVLWLGTRTKVNTTIPSTFDYIQTDAFDFKEELIE